MLETEHWGVDLEPQSHQLTGLGGGHQISDTKNAEGDTWTGATCEHRCEALNQQNDEASVQSRTHLPCTWVFTMVESGRDTLNSRQWNSVNKAFGKIMQPGAF